MCIISMVHNIHGLCLQTSSAYQTIALPSVSNTNRHEPQTLYNAVQPHQLNVLRELNVCKQQQTHSVHTCMHA